MDGIAGISARIAQIQALVAPQATRPVGGTATTSSTSGSTFATALADEVAKSSTTTSTGKLNADGVPVELAAYGNGHIPESALRTVGTTNGKLWGPASEKLEQAITAASKDGVHIGITDSYRSYEAQVDVAQRKGLYSQGGLAAKPGTSEHGWGMATDLKLDAAGLKWMRAHGGEYGFVESTPRETWHWSYHPERVS